MSKQVEKIGLVNGDFFSRSLSSDWEKQQGFRETFIMKMNLSSSGKQGYQQPTLAVC